MSKGKKISRERAKVINAALLQEFNIKGLEFITGGSIRRKKPLVGDIDIAVKCSSEYTRKRFNTRLGELFGFCSTKPERAKRFGAYQGVQINFFDVLRDQIGAALLFCTGSGGFNMRMRCQAKRRGLLLNQYGLWNRKYRDEEICDASQEENIFKALKIDFISPPNREDGAIGWA